MQPAATTSNAVSPQKRAMSILTHSRLLAVLPFVIAAIALLLRLQGIDWDGGSFYHPDERSIYLRADTMYRTLTEAPGWETTQNRDFPLDTPGIPSLETFFDKDASPLNPHWFPLGSIIIYILVVVQAVLLEPLMDQVRLQDLASAGRTIAALVDAGSVLLLFFLGRRLYSPAVGFLASTFAAFTVINIQLTHFYRPESFVILLALGAFWWMLNVLEHGRKRDHIGLALMVGLSFAFRASGAPLLVPVLATYGVLVWRHRQMARSTTVQAVGLVLPRALMAGVIALATFAVLQPYAFLDYHKFFGDLGWETMIARNAGSVPYTVQFVGMPRTGIYEIQQSAIWALGLPLGIAAWLGFASSSVRAFYRQHTGELLVLSWAWALLLVIATFEVKFLRYIAPILPVMVLLGSRWLVDAYRWAQARSVVTTRIATAVIAFVVVATVWYGFAFVGIYATEHPGIQASRWMNENARIGSVVLTDNHWDEGFPDMGRFHLTQLPMYEGDTLRKVERVSGLLASADYIMAYSNRPWGSITRLPERYPYSSNYYEALFDGSLGYELVQAFERPPSFLGVTLTHDPFTRAGVQKPDALPGVDRGGIVFDLGWADENVVNYDHPLTLVWENTGRLGSGEITAIMLGLDGPPREEPAMLSAEAFAEQRAGGTWSEIFSEGGLNGAAPWLVWLLAIELIAWVTMPLAVRTLRWLPDRGVVFARPLGLLLVAWLVWLGASVGVWSFGRASVVQAIAIVAAGSGVLFWRNRRVLMAQARRNWRYLVSVEVLLIAAYAAFVLIRFANPDLWHPYRGGEKPMDLSYLTAVVKSTSFPPYDPWYAGGLINYYYFGFVPIASLMRLTGIVPEVAYNLAIPMLFAMTLTGAFSIGFNLAATLRRTSFALRRGPSPVIAGVATALLMTVLANLDGAGQVLQGVGRMLNDEPFGWFDFWRSSRLMPGQIAINEFPFWSFLFADLHAHTISIPFQVLTIGLAANLMLGARRKMRLLRRVPAALALAFVLGSFAAMNTWEVPTYGVLSLGALGVTALVAYRDRWTPRVAGGLLLSVLAFGVAAYALWLPFHQNYDSVFAGFRMSQWRTVAWHYMVIHGLFIFLIGSWLAVEARRRLLGDQSAAETRSVMGSDKLTLALAPLAAGLVVALFVTTPAVREWTNVAVLVLFVSVVIALLGWWLSKYRTTEAPVQLLLVGLLLVAFGIGIGVDVATAERDIDRMNTVFKFYLHAWIMLSVVGGVGLWQLWRSGAFRWPSSWGWRMAKGGWLMLLALLVLSTAIFPVLGTHARVRDRFDTSVGATLDGRAFQASVVYHDPGPSDRGTDPNARYALAADMEAIDYIRENVEGTPVFLEAVTNQYRWTPRISVWAGLPVVVGWHWHQVQQRGAGGSEPAYVNARIGDVQMMYRTTDTNHFSRLLDEYEVEYVYLGPTERLYFPAEGLAKFQELEGSLLEVLFRNDDVTVYKVVRG